MSKVGHFFLSLVYIVIFLVLLIVGYVAIQDHIDNAAPFGFSFLLVPIGYILYVIAFDTMIDSRKRGARTVLTIVGSVLAVGVLFVTTMVSNIVNRDALMSIKVYGLAMNEFSFLFTSALLLVYFLNAGIWNNDLAAVIVPPIALVASFLICLFCALARQVFVSLWLPVVFGLLCIGATIVIRIAKGSPFD